MIPYSLGTGPVDFAIRMACPLHPQLTIAESPLEDLFELDDSVCTLSIDEHGALLTAGGFTSIEDATKYFSDISLRIADVCLRKRLALSIPTTLNHPTKSRVSFIPGDIQCMRHGWPEVPIAPLVIDPRGAFVYPEHDYVAIYAIFGGNRTVVTTSVSDFVGSLCAVPKRVRIVEESREALVAAIDNFLHARRSTQWVWSFLLGMATLEMMSVRAESTPATVQAVRALSMRAKQDYGSVPEVEIQVILNRLGEAKQESITSAVKRMVRENCAPGIARAPLSSCFIDPTDCDRKVAAMYLARSKYIHEGGVAQAGKIGYEFNELHAMTLDVLAHILRIRLNSIDCE